MGEKRTKKRRRATDVTRGSDGGLLELCISECRASWVLVWTVFFPKSLNGKKTSGDKKNSDFCLSACLSLPINSTAEISGVCA